MFVSSPGEGFARPAVQLLKEGFSSASVGSLNLTIIGSAHSAWVRECFRRPNQSLAFLDWVIASNEPLYLSDGDLF